MKIAAALFAVLLLCLGGLFVLSAFHPEAVAQGKSLPRLIAGGVPILGAVVLLVLAWRPRPSAAGVTGAMSGQEPPGGLSFKALKCPHCGGQVEAATAKLSAEGTMTISCGYCKGSFIVQEEPKW